MINIHLLYIEWFDHESVHRQTDEQTGGPAGPTTLNITSIADAGGKNGYL